MEFKKCKYTFPLMSNIYISLYILAIVMVKYDVIIY